MSPQRSWQGLILVLVVCGLLLVGCGSTPTTTTAPEASPDETTTQADTTISAQASLAPAAEQLAQLNGKAKVIMTVEGQPIEIEVDGEQAPITAGNFIDLVERGVYNGLVFHRVVRDPNFSIAQGGDPQSGSPDVPRERLGTGSFMDPDTGEPRFIPLETSPELTHKRGAIAMARSSMPNSASAQFYITSNAIPALDGGYAVFGYVTSGMDVVDAIEEGDRIDSAIVVEGIENFQPPES
ncbi:MAG: peptidylprolyl isomerase [Spirulinaceae cyanobacterium SM2_1_0]|nr:peptidylprolyl isomerase [Spirulinaceae cyanobacterium SM2_1_0]